MNCTNIPVNWPTVRSDYIEAYRFEVYDFERVCGFITDLLPWIYVTAVLYVVGIFTGRRLMREREPFQLRTPLFWWNVGLAALSAIAHVRMLPEMYYNLTQPHGFYRAFCTMETHNYATGFWLVTLLLSKILELGDTVFIVLRKQKLIFLHWYHHVTVLLCCFILFGTFDPLLRLSAVLNSFVHTVMYSYYAVRARGVKIPRAVAMSITGLQLVQFVIVVAAHFYTLAMQMQGVPCYRPPSNMWWFTVLGPSYLILFGRFFVKVYLAPTQKSGKGD